MTFITSPTKGSLMALLKDPDNIGAPEWRRLFDGVMFKDEFNKAIAGGLDIGSSSGSPSTSFSAYVRVDGSTPLTNNWEAGNYYIQAKTLRSDVLTGTAPLKVESTTKVTNLNADQVDGYDAADMDYDFVSGNDGATDVTAAELEELSDGSDTALHTHATALAGYLPLAGGTMTGALVLTNNVPVSWGVFGGGTEDLLKFDGSNIFGVGSQLRVINIAGSADRPSYVTGGTPYDLALLEDLDDIDYDFVSDNDAATDVTGAELEELTDESTTTLHSHAVNQQLVCLSTYVDLKERQTEWNLHGGLVVIDTGHDLGAGDLVTEVGIGKVILSIIAANDYAGDITITGTTVDRNTGVETAADTDTITIDALTTDDSDTDASSNVRHSFTGAYISSKWFKGAITISSADTDVTDMDTYQVAFEQVNDNPETELQTADLTAYANNASAWMYGYLYILYVTGDKCNIVREGALELPAAEVGAGLSYRIRRGNLGLEFDGTTDGFWADIFPGPLNQNYWEDCNVKFWFAIGAGETTITGYEISGSVTGSPGISGVTMSLTGDASDSTSTDANGDYSFIDIPNGSYTVTPTKTNYTFVPASTNVTVNNGDQTGKDFVGTAAFQMPYVENFESDTVGDNHAALESKDTHYDVFGTGCTVQLDDYDAMPAIVGPSFDQCLTSIGTNIAGSNMLVGAGEGFVPSSGDKTLLEAVFYCAGTGGQVELYARNAANDEGILAFYAFGANFSLATISGGTPTTKVSVATGLSSPPLGACWFYFGVEYNHTTDGVKLRIIEFGATGATQEDTGWVDGGTITPTFDNTEWINFYGLSKSNTAAYQGYAQLRVANSDNDGYGLGEFEQHNYVVP